MDFSVQVIWSQSSLNSCYSVTFPHALLFIELQFIAFSREKETDIC